MIPSLFIYRSTRAWQHVTISLGGLSFHYFMASLVLNEGINNNYTLHFKIEIPFLGTLKL